MQFTEYRKACGLSQAKLGNAIGIPKRTIENWETGGRTPSPYVDYLICYWLANEYGLEMPERDPGRQCRPECEDKELY